MGELVDVRVGEGQYVQSAVLGKYEENYRYFRVMVQNVEGKWGSMWVEEENIFESSVG